ncbi:ComEC/Rec2 family competence protein [Leptospira ilyithenensis]|uniref:ComEC/Rec2 family competence protein n=1 Tax=Leptospira ilyithenensis TaxID=2484901 RepID=A0A4R9LR07_9LEPT|nr:ComEC/Rec2 family competence protein [Leptospira ilyithenensis]TGN09125.1 ComEC/Rec2 family competence protein [Leptospira ilyithenensis]
MKSSPLPRIFPASEGGMVSLGICLVGLLNRIYPNIPGFSFLICIGSILFLLLPPFFSRFIKSYLKKKFLYLIIGFLVFGCFQIYFPKGFPKEKRINQNSNPYKFQEEVRGLLKESKLPKELALVAEGLVLGSGKSLPKSVKQEAKEGGVLHLFAASGLHLGIYLGFCLLFLKRVFWFSRILPVLVSLLFGYFYLYLLNFPVSFVRAYSFAFYSMLGVIFYKKAQSSDTLFYSGATVALFFPGDYLSVGFLLSFGAVFGIFFLKPAIDKVLFPNISHFLKDNLTLSLSCSFGTFPSLAYVFHSFSFGSILINLIVIPLAGIILPLLYLCLIIQKFLFQNIADLFWIITDLFLRILLKLVTALPGKIGFYYEWNDKQTGIWLYFIFTILLFIIIYKIFKPKDIVNNPKIGYSFFHFLILSGIVLFFPFGVLILSVKQSQENLPVHRIQKGNAFFFGEEKISILGNCYSQNQFETFVKSLRLQNMNANSIFFEKESCLRYVLDLQKEILKTNVSARLSVITNEEKLEPWLKQINAWNENFQIDRSETLPVVLFGKKNPIPVLRYTGDKKKFSKLLEITSLYEKNWIKSGLNSETEQAGILLLDFPKWVKENPEDWKKYQKLLGISSYWKIISVEELLVRSHNQTLRDQKFSFL